MNINLVSDEFLDGIYGGCKDYGQSIQVAAHLLEFTGLREAYKSALNVDPQDIGAAQQSFREAIC